jgi:uncharacterized protein (TIGR02145 family)
MKQKNKIQLLLVAVFAGLSVMCYAQGKLCKDGESDYKIVSLQDPSDFSSYKWTENGKEISVYTAEHTVLKDKELGKYTYVRHSKKEGCDWASSNAYTVEVLNCNTEIGGATGNTGVFTDDRDNKVYKAVRMADGKVWMAENLNYQKDLAFIQDATQPDNGHVVGSFWCPAVSGATISADKNTCNTYGALYTWETAMSENGLGTWEESQALKNRYHDNNTTPADAIDDPQNHKGICPSGWHLPTDYEWANLLDKVDTHCGSYTSQVGIGWYGSEGVAGVAEGIGAGVQMKSASTYLGSDPGNGAWADNDTRGNDATGFGTAPAGNRNITGPQLSGRGIAVLYWSSSVGSSTTAWSRQFYYNYAQVLRYLDARSYGFSVRCVRN